jgi:cellulose synthase/poly-beta-1,6-N-acetylglucosamine synthase-like glycosyltransferase
LNILLYIAVVLVLSQSFVVWLLRKNFKYALCQPWGHRKPFTPKTLLTIPCKGIDNRFAENITSLILQNYLDFEINFVVEDVSDPAYQALCDLKQNLAEKTKAKNINILISGQAFGCSQKIHNLLHSYKNCPPDIEVLAFADSDICVKDNWLEQLVKPLIQNKTGMTTGYRWFVPEKNTLANMTLSIGNAIVAQFLSKSPFNHAWGGSMAIKTERFKEFNVDKIWPNVLSDDLSISCAVKKVNKKVVFVPDCIVASFENTTWPKLFEFARRQFLITRVSARWTWLFGFLSSFYSITGFGGSIVLAIWAIVTQPNHCWIYITVAIFFITSHFYKASLRNRIVKKRLAEVHNKFTVTFLADLIAGPLVTVIIFALILSSAFGRVIKWRGKKYKLLNAYKTIILDK